MSKEVSKEVRVMESRGREGGRSKRRRGGPLFFVSVASKGFTHAVSLLFATLAGIFVSVAAKGLMGEFSEVWQGTEFGDRE